MSNYNDPEMYTAKHGDQCSYCMRPLPEQTAIKFGVSVYCSDEHFAQSVVGKEWVKIQRRKIISEI